VLFIKQLGYIPWILFTLLGAVALSDPQPGSVEKALPVTLDDSTLGSLTERLRLHVHRLAGEIGERNVFRAPVLQAAADYIRGEWQAQGYPVVSQVYEVEDVPSENLEVTRIGTSNPDEIILLGAHYDSVWGSPGANDNASGVAALLEISRFFTTLLPQYSVRFVAFVNEEPPFFMDKQMGSFVYAKAARSRGEAIRLMISLETIGYYSDEPDSQRYPPLLKYCYPDQANFIAFVANLSSRQVLHQTVAAFRAHSDFPAESLATFEFIPGVAWSDQLSFWRQGYPALMVTDTAFYRYAYYHTAQDTPEKLNYSAMAQVVAGLQKAIQSLATATE
jgi:Zn-dependent M28 family amino/carboxypeptidase